MTSYDISGTFYEACDCEVICSCWAGLPPEMGSCTGIFIWEIENGKVDGIDVKKGSKVAVLSSGLSCDISKHMLVLIEGSGTLLKAFNDPGPWHDVFQAQSFALGTNHSAGTATINITESNNRNSVGVSITKKTLSDFEGITTAELSFTVKPVNLTGTNQNLLVDRVVGSADNKSVEVGVVDTPIDSTKNGLNLLVDINDYRFDLDISRVTAVRGQFHYVKS
jgi:hypothetical protein